MAVTATDPNLLKSFREHRDKITQCIFSHNAKQIISSSMDGVVLATSLKANSRANKFVGHKGPVYGVSINPSNTLIASCSRDTTIRIWSNNASAKSTVIKGHSAPVKSVDFNADGRMLITASDDKLVKIWSVEDLKFQQTFTGHQNWVKSAVFSHDSRMIASGSDDRTVRLWDCNVGRQIQMFTDHTGMVNQVRFHPDSTCLASCGTDRKIKIFDCRSHRLLQHYDAHDEAVNSIAFNLAGSHLISTSNDGTVKIWDLRRGCIQYTLYGHEGATSAASWSPSGDHFLTGGADSVVLCWASNMNANKLEDMEGLGAKIETELFVTQKERVDKLPSTRGTKMGRKAAKSKSKARKAEDASVVDAESQGQAKQKPEEEVSAAAQVVNGMTYRKLKPEVKKTLEKIVYQLELVGKTLQLMEQRVMDSEDKLQEVMAYIKSTDLEFKPSLVNHVLSMNRYDEVTGLPLQTASPKKDFGVPLPGEPSLAFTLEKNKLADIYGRVANSVQMLGEHPEARELIEKRGLGQLYATGSFREQTPDGSERQAMMPMGNGQAINISSYGTGNLGVDVDLANRPLGATLPEQPDAAHPLQAPPNATEQLTSQMAHLGQTQEAVNVFSTMKISGDEV